MTHLPFIADGPALTQARQTLPSPMHPTARMAAEDVGVAREHYTVAIP
jgi:hypothetical protein